MFDDNVVEDKLYDDVDVDVVDDVVDVVDDNNVDDDDANNDDDDIFEIIYKNLDSNFSHKK